MCYGAIRLASCNWLASCLCHKLIAHSLYEFCFVPVTVVNASDGHAGAIAVSPSALENAVAAAAAAAADNVSWVCETL